MQSKNPAEIEKREAIISAYCTVREAVEIEVEKYNLLGYQPKMIEDILQWDTINAYGLPLCFNTIEADLADLVTKSE